MLGCERRFYLLKKIKFLSKTKADFLRGGFCSLQGAPIRFPILTKKIGKKVPVKKVIQPVKIPEILPVKPYF